MARVCIAGRRFPSQVVGAALVLAAVAAEPVTSENNSAPEIQVPQNDEASSLNVEPVQDVSSTPRKYSRDAHRILLSCVTKMVVLSDFAVENRSEAAVFEGSVLRNAIAKTVEEDNDVNRNELEKTFQEWARLKFLSGPVTSIDEAAQLCAVPLVKSGQMIRAVETCNQLRETLLTILTGVENYPLLIAELHKLHGCFHDITPEAVEQHKELMKKFWRSWDHGSESGGQDTDFDALERDEELENNLDFKMDDFVTLSQEADAETVEA